MNAFKLRRLSLAVASALGLPGVAHAQLIINDTLTGTNSVYNWVSLNGACLTAGDGSKSTIPACVAGGNNLAYYGTAKLVGGNTGTLPDVSGQGALRLTNGDTTAGTNGNNQTGAIVSNFTFPTNEGIQVTWTSVTYGGNAYKNAKGALSGADGISFFLSDGAQSPTVGALGGSLGYSCSNGNGTYDGVVGGYLGIGMDEYGNFSNAGDNTSSGAGGAQPGAIVVRGAGHTAWSWLTANYATYYPSSLSSASRATAVKATCKAGKLYNYSGISQTYNGTSYANGAQLPIALDFNYPYLTSSVLPAGTTIYSQEAAGTNSSGGSVAVRGSATPITYSLQITQAGLLTFKYSVNGGSASTVINGLNITASNGPLPGSFRFGFSAGTGGGSNVHEITCFKAVPNNNSNSSAGSNVLTGQVQTDSQVYLAYSHPTNSWGSVTAQNLIFTAGTSTTASTLKVSPIVSWDAGCVLTGGACLSQSNATVNAPLTNTTRQIISFNGTQGVPFEWSNLTSGTTSQQTSLGSSDRLDYLRGLRTKEVSAGGAFRNRTGLLGDIVDSSPLWVGPPSLSYGASPMTDLLAPTVTQPEGTSYTNYVSTYGQRTNVVYIGANDGMLHGFRAGYYNTSGSLVQATNDGQEVLAYVPSQVVSTIHSATNGALDFSSPSYSHNFYVDAPPGQGDLYYGNAWHTWLVGGLGPGGQAAGPVADTTTVETGTVFALDVTDPTTFSESAASSLVMGEWSSTSLNSTTCIGVSANCGDRLGATYGTPLVRRLHDGTWGVIFGNGLNSKNGTAGLFIVHIDTSTGAQTVQYIDTGKGSTTSRNGIVQATAADLDGDHITDYVYAGDVQGNVWRFDLTNATASNWSVGSTPLFTTQSGQPISSAIAVAKVTTPADIAGLTKRIMLAFGTGQKLPQTLNASASYPTTQQSIYGIWDANMTAWNLKSAAQYAALTSPPPIVAGVGGNLYQHTVTIASGGTRTTDLDSATTICWNGTTVCSSGNIQMGWELDLPVTTATSTQPAAAEQVLFSPLIVGTVFNTNTDIPLIAQPLTCDTSLESAYSYGIDLSTGGAATTTTTTTTGSTTTTSSSSYFSGYIAGTLGIGTQATGTPSYVTGNDGSQWLVYQKTDGSGGTQQIQLPGTGTAGGKPDRLTWIKLR